MPSFCLRSNIRESADSFVLSLGACHVFTAGSPSQKVYNAKGRLPEDVDVVLASNLVFSLSGVLGSTRVAAEAVQHSAMAQRLLSYLKMNSPQLGLNTVSEVYVDEDDGLAKFIVASSRPMLSGRRHPTVHLVSMNLVFRWRSTASDEVYVASVNGTDDVNPFGPQAYLPMMSALDPVLENFVCWHLVRRYPLIFGPWRNRLDLEHSHFPAILRSITHMARRSPNAPFRKKFRRLMKTLEVQEFSSRSSASSAFHEYLRLPVDRDDSEEDNRDTFFDSDHDALSRSLERLFRLEIRPGRYKGCGTGSVSVRDDDRDEVEFDFSQDMIAAAKNTPDEIINDEGFDDRDEDSGLDSSQDLDDNEFTLDIDGHWPDGLPDDDSLALFGIEDDSRSVSPFRLCHDFSQSCSDSEYSARTPHTSVASMEDLDITELFPRHSQTLFQVLNFADGLSHDDLYAEAYPELECHGVGGGLALSHDLAARSWSPSDADAMDVFDSPPCSPAGCSSMDDLAFPAGGLVDDVVADNLNRSDGPPQVPTPPLQVTDSTLGDNTDQGGLDFDWDFPDFDFRRRSSDDDTQPSADEIKEAHGLFLQSL